MKTPKPVQCEPGDMLESAMWLDGRERPEDRKRFEADCRAAVAATESQSNVIAGPVIFTEKRPGEERVPPVPDHVAGPNVRLLVAEAKVIDHRRLVIQTSFLTELETKDLLRLRQITKQAFAKSHPGQSLTDEQADAVIERLGPDAALDALRTMH